MGLKLDCPMHKGRAARLDSAHVARVNHEYYFFADRRSRLAFLKAPLRHCGFLTEPVTLERFKPGARSPRMKYAGRDWFFAGDSTFAVFRAMPDSFVVRRRSM